MAVRNSPNENLSKSSFTFTFTIEFIGNETWTDFTSGWLELQQPVQTLKLNYNLYPGLPPNEIYISIWPVCAKISCNGNVTWVRTWLFLDRRWLAFSISHLITARVAELLPFVINVVPVSTGIQRDESAKDHKAPKDDAGTQDHKEILEKVYVPPLKFGQQRYFAPVLLTEDQDEEPIEEFVVNMVDSLIKLFIPLSVYDGIFDQPHPVSDIRHQDAIIHHVREMILNKKVSTLYETFESTEPITNSNTDNKEKRKLSNDKKRNKSSKEKKNKEPKTPETDKKGREIPKRSNYELCITGNEILSGAGRLIKLRVNNENERPNELGNIIALLSTKSLPAPDDTPVFFVNVESLNQIPVNEFEKAGIHDLRIFWRFGEVEHISERHLFQSENANFSDHQAIALYPPQIASDMVASLLDNPFEIEIHGFRRLEQEKAPILFGYDPGDSDLNWKMHPPKLKEENNDVLIAVCRIDLHPLATSTSGLIRGDFSLDPPKVSCPGLGREAICTNDFNAIKSTLVPELVIQPHIILESLMTLEVSVGLVGCKLRDVNRNYSRFFCVIKESDHVMTLLKEITDANESLITRDKKVELLTGFALDTGNEVFVYLEGPRDGQILRIWELTEDFYPSVRPVFSTSSRYASRIYPDLLASSVPVILMKMHVPLNCLLACPPVYTKPGAPLPARAAILKLGRILAGTLYYPPTSNEMPTMFEMRSFRLEFCSPPKLISAWPDQNQNINVKNMADCSPASNHIHAGRQDIHTPAQLTESGWRSLQDARRMLHDICHAGLQPHSQSSRGGGLQGLPFMGHFTLNKNFLVTKTTLYLKYGDDEVETIMFSVPTVPSGRLARSTSLVPGKFDNVLDKTN